MGVWALGAYASVLVDRYTFAPDDVTVLANPTRSDIFREFEELTKRVGKDDSVMLFYAGHGIWDETREQGYWLPVDATESSRSSWISNGDITDQVRAVNSRHTLLITDACFSGGIFKSRSAFIGASRAVTELFKLSSRKAMTSGALKTVPDESTFLRYLGQRLTENDERFLTADTLFSSFRTAVVNNSPTGQTPLYGHIQGAGDEGGEFVFVRKDGSSQD